MADNLSQTPNISKEVQDQGKAPNWFVKAYILRGRNDKYSEFYDRNIEHIKFFVKHVISDIELEKRIVDDPDESKIKEDVEALVNEANQKLNEFKYTKVMLIFSVYGNVKKFLCQGKEICFKDIQSIMDRSNILKVMSKVIIVDAFGGNEGVEALGPKQTTCGAVSNLPDGMNLLNYCGMLKNYRQQFLNGSLFLRVVFHELLIENSIDLNEVFQACTSKLTNDYDNETVERNKIDKTGQVEDPVIKLNLGDTTRSAIKSQYLLEDQNLMPNYFS